MSLLCRVEGMERVNVCHQQCFAPSKERFFCSSDRLPLFLSIIHSQSNETVTNGGRVLAVTGLGATITAAVRNAYTAADLISFEGKHVRTDIAHRGKGSPIRLGVLGSTRGTALQAVIDAIESGKLNAKITLIVSNKKDAGILERAAKHKIPCRHVPVNGRNREAYDAEVSACLKRAGVQLVLMVRTCSALSSSPLPRPST